MSAEHDEPSGATEVQDRWAMDADMLAHLMAWATEHGYDPVLALRLLRKAWDRIPTPGDLERPIPNFAATRLQLHEFMHYDVYEHELFLWSQAASVTGITYVDQLRLIFHGQLHTPLLAWDEDDQDLFVQDVRAGMGWEKLARIHQLPVSQARGLVKMFRSPPDTSQIGVDHG
jgi:hypothetical protein